MRKLISLLMLLCLFTVPAYADVSGVTYEDFQSSYSENINFINENASRHLLPLIPVKTVSDLGDGRTYYDIEGDVLSLHIRVDMIGYVESCTITLTAPPNMAYGNNVHRDFTTSGFQHYAMLMAMDASATAFDRYQLVEQVEGGLVQGGGEYQCMLDVYQLKATSVDGTVTVEFTNTSAQPTLPPTPTDAPATDAQTEASAEETP